MAEYIGWSLLIDMHPPSAHLDAAQLGVCLFSKRLSPGAAKEPSRRIRGK